MGTETVRVSFRVTGGCGKISKFCSGGISGLKNMQSHFLCITRYSLKAVTFVLAKFDVGCVIINIKLFD